MTAVENNIQDQLDRVAKQVAGEETVDESTVKADPNVQNQDDDQGLKDDGSNQEGKTDPETNPEDDKKQASAFAAMRKRLKELEEENKTLKQGTQPPKKEEPPKEDPSTNPEISALAKRLEELEAYNKSLQQKQVETIVTRQIEDLTKEFNLTADDLAILADEIETRGYDLNNLKMPLRDMYVAINHENLVKAEVERIKKEIQNGMSTDESAPTGGPKQTGGTSTKANDDIRSTLLRVASKIQ